MYRQMYQSPGNGVYQQPYNKNMQYSLADAGNFYPPGTTLQQQQQMYYAGMGAQYGAQRLNKGQMAAAANAGQKFPRGAAPGFQKNNGYQLKVGGVVVGSWANNSRGGSQQAARMGRAGMVSLS